ncbi:MAG TPA: aminotransferase class III-fold pyridoxal phosphate-dependent enzyme [Anaerolineae bacterium]|nr:aminotransferase class III-fold pyridoxal phosphate-dependent enzyme [Anaerolineae bacterium]
MNWAVYLFAIFCSSFFILPVFEEISHICGWYNFWGAAPGSHGNTFSGNPLACAASLATIELLENKYINNVYKVRKYALSILNQIKEVHSSIGDVRGKGLMIGVEFIQDPILKTYAPDIRDVVVSNCFQTGLLL